MYQATKIVCITILSALRPYVLHHNLNLYQRKGEISSTLSCRPYPLSDNFICSKTRDFVCTIPELSQYLGEWTQYI